MKKFFTVGIMMAVILMSFGWVQGEAQMIDEGKTVEIHYTLTVDGAVVDSSVGQEPLEYVQGEEMIIPGLEKELNGMSVGEKKMVVVASQDAYGPKDERAVIEVPKGDFAEGQEPQVGMMIQIPTQTGDPLVGVVEEISDETMVLNFNHPLAGKDLNFDVEIVSVR